MTTRVTSCIALVTGAGAAGGIGAWGRRSRATSAEKRRSLPGDELVPEPMWQATRAITIHAPCSDVWPWLVQMGYPTHRGGWYTPRWLDRLIFGITARSADTIVEELQNLAVGDRALDSETGVSFFTVARLDPDRALVLYSTTHPLPAYTNVSFAWAFVLEDTGADTRLIMRARVSYTPVWPAALVALLIRVGFGIGDFVQAGGMLGGIKRRAGRRPLRPLPPVAPRGAAAVDLYWIPLGAGGHSVRFNGKVFEAIEATRQHRQRCDLYHAALIVNLDGEQYTIELAPSPDADEASRGVITTGAVGSRLIAGLRVFRYEVRCWRGGSIPDLDYAVGGPTRLTSNPAVARRMLDVLPTVPVPVWGRDELQAGEMWNSNSMISWLIATAGLPTARLRPPVGGRAPGWDAGLKIARRTHNREPDWAAPATAPEAATH